MSDKLQLVELGRQTEVCRTFELKNDPLPNSDRHPYQFCLENAIEQPLTAVSTLAIPTFRRNALKSPHPGGKAPIVLKISLKYFLRKAQSFQLSFIRVSRIEGR